MEVKIGTATVFNGTWSAISTNGNPGIGTMSPDEKFEVEWVTDGTDAEIGKGTSDIDVTFLALRSPNPTKWHIYPAENAILPS